jgi:hypothetical protein
MTQSIWIGLDVHAESITAAILVGDARDAEIVTLPGDLTKVRRLFRRLEKQGTPRACYEASGAGFVLLHHHQLHRLRPIFGLQPAEVDPTRGRV